MRLFAPTVDMMIEAPVWEPPMPLRLPPDQFPTLGALPSGTRTIDTGTLEVEGSSEPGGVFEQGPTEPEIAVFVFDGGDYATDLTIYGPRPAAILFRGSVQLAGRIDASAAGARAGGPGLGAWPGGAGAYGGAGGASGCDASGGAVYGPQRVFECGSGGQSGAGVGGYGGGALQLGASDRLHLERIRLLADGGAGAPSRDGADDDTSDRGADGDTSGGGAGSGGTLVLHGRDVQLAPTAVLSVRGGNGGDGRDEAAGGGGGGGGFILGVTAHAGSFDPRGAEFLVEGGVGGFAAYGRPGDDGGPGVVLLSAKRPVSRSRARTAGRGPSTRSLVQRGLPRA